MLEDWLAVAYTLVHVFCVLEKMKQPSRQTSSIIILDVYIFMDVAAT